MQQENIFLQLGFTKSEARLYLTALRLGPASAIQIARKLSVTRQLVYSLLPNLEERGLVKQLRTGNKRLYQAIEPEVLTDLVSGLSEQISQAIPALKTRSANHGSMPLVTVYDSPISIREWYRYIMKTVEAGEEFLIWSTNTAWYQMDPTFFDKYLQFKIKHQIKDRVIAPDTPAAQTLEKQVSSPFATYRYIDSAWKTPAEKVIWRNQVAHFTINSNATNMILLESAELADLERVSFEQVWNQNK